MPSAPPAVRPALEDPATLVHEVLLHASCCQPLDAGGSVHSTYWLRPTIDGGLGCAGTAGAVGDLGRAHCNGLIGVKARNSDQLAAFMHVYYRSMVWSWVVQLLQLRDRTIRLQLRLFQLHKVSQSDDR